MGKVGLLGWINDQKGVRHYVCQGGLMSHAQGGALDATMVEVGDGFRQCFNCESVFMQAAAKVSVTPPTPGVIRFRQWNKDKMVEVPKGSELRLCHYRCQKCAFVQQNLEHGELWAVMTVAFSSRASAVEMFGEEAVARCESEPEWQPKRGPKEKGWPHV